MYIQQLWVVDLCNFSDRVEQWAALMVPCQTMTGEQCNGMDCFRIHALGGDESQTL